MSLAQSHLEGRVGGTEKLISHQDEYDNSMNGTTVVHAICAPNLYWCVGPQSHLLTLFSPTKALIPLLRTFSADNGAKCTFSQDCFSKSQRSSILQGFASESSS